MQIGGEDHTLQARDSMYFDFGHTAWLSPVGLEDLLRDRRHRAVTAGARVETRRSADACTTRTGAPDLDTESTGEYE